MEAQLGELTATYDQLCASSTQQLQQLEQQLAKEEERKVDVVEGRAEVQRRGCSSAPAACFSLLTKCGGTFYKMLL